MKVYLLTTYREIGETEAIAGVYVFATPEAAMASWAPTPPTWAGVWGWHPDPSAPDEWVFHGHYGDFATVEAVDVRAESLTIGAYGVPIT